MSQGKPPKQRRRQRPGPRPTPSAAAPPAEPPPGLRHDLWAAGTIAALVACVGVYVLYGWIDSGWFGVILALVIMSVVGLAARVALTKYLREGGSAKAFAGAAAILVFGLILVAGEL